MKKLIISITFLFSIVYGLFAQSEQLLVDENFQSWTNLSASAATTVVSNKTLITNETLNYSLWGISVINNGYASGASTNTLSTAGCLKMAKNTEITTGTMSIELSPLASITKIWFVECTTGSNRGFKVWKKNATDADWVAIYSTVCNPSSGMAVNLTLNETNVALKFTNLSLGNYAFLSDFKIWGNVSGVAIPPTVSSVTPAHGASIPVSGSISVVYSENVTRGTGNITIGGVAVPEQNITISNATVTIAYSGLNTDSSYELVIPAGAFKNGAGTPTSNDTKATYKTPDTILPTLSNKSVSDGAVLPVNGFISLVMSESCQAGSTQVTIGSKSITPAVSASNANLMYINYSGLAYDTDYTLVIPSGAITDLSGNPYAGTSISFHTEADAKGTQLFSFTPDATSVPATSTGTVTQTVNGYTIEFGGVASAGPRSSSPYTYSFKTNYVLLPELPSVGELSFYIQSGGGTVPQEYYIQKLAADGTTWNTIETIILGTNDKNMVKTAAAQSSVPTRLRLMYNSAQLWLYTLDVYSYTGNGPVDDGLKPSVVSSIPADNAVDVPINGSIKLVFSENVKTGAGSITLDGKTLSPGIVGKNVTLPYSNLKYATNYTLSIPAGAIRDAFNNDCEAISISFTTKAKPAVTPRLFNFVVAADGTGNGTTIQSAFDAVPLNNSSQFLIFVKNGTYNEYPTLAETKNNVSLIGQSQSGVIITGNRRSGVGGYSTSTCQTVEIMADNFYCENLTMQNTAGVGAGQAVALKVYADKAVFKNVKLIGYQDTHLTSNTGADRQYYLNCDIRGSVDFIFGNGVCYFDNCLLYIQDRNIANVICAPSTSAENTYGYVFNNCTIDGASSQDGIYNLGRPWQNSPRAVYLNTKMNILPSGGGWISMSTIPALFAEYNSVNAANNPVVVDARNTAFSYTDSNNNLITGNSPTAVLTSTQAANYSLSNVLAGADSWDATLKGQQTATVSGISLTNNTMSWAQVDGALCYLIFKNGNFVTQTTTNSLTVSSGTYELMAVSEFGALSEPVSFVADVVSGAIQPSRNTAFLQSAYIENQIILKNTELIKSVSLFNPAGQLIYRSEKTAGNIDCNSLSSGCYILSLSTENEIITYRIIRK